jgi:hypothetical protein
MMTNFYNALGLALRADVGAGSLVVLTGHAAGDNRILRERPKTVGKYPALVFMEEENPPFIESSLTSYKRTTMCFTALDKVETNTIKIADRLEFLLHKDASKSNLSYFNMSLASVLVNTGTRFLNRENIKYDENTEVSMINIYAEFYWFLV